MPIKPYEVDRTEIACTKPTLRGMPQQPDNHTHPGEDVDRVNSRHRVVDAKEDARIFGRRRGAIGTIMRFAFYQ